MNLKTKLTLGLVLLFGFLLLVSILGMFNIHTLATDTNAILKDNYKTLEYVQRMQHAMDQLVSDPGSREVFEKNLRLQQQNITEQGESDATDALARAYTRLTQNFSDSAARQEVHRYLLQITDLNLQAMARKNEQARITAEQSVMILGFIATLCVLVGFTFLLNFPGYIANPIRQLTEGIQEVARGNYTQRIHLDRHDEFGELTSAFNELTAKLDAYEHSNLARLMFEKKRLETIIGAMHDPVIGLDEHRRVLFANEPALTLLNLPASKLIDKDARELALTNDLLRTLLNRMALPDAEPIKIFADGKESFFLLEALNIAVRTTPGADRQAIGQVLLLKNITAFRERDVAKTNFIATISHELKTPISSIKMGLRLLDDERVGQLNDEQRHLLRQLDEDAGRLLSITGELLKIAQAETGNIQLNLAPIEPESIVETARQTLLSQAQEKNVTIEIDPVPKVGKAALADADKAAWILVNLLSNAIHYTPKGSSVRISTGFQNEYFRFAVRDQGPGIPAEFHSKIFDRFFRVPGTDANGTGLGLAISREFALAMGGDIGMDSEVGKGSTFWFTLRGV